MNQIWKMLRKSDGFPILTVSAENGDLCSLLLHLLWIIQTEEVMDPGFRKMKI